MSLADVVVIIASFAGAIVGGLLTLTANRRVVEQNEKRRGDPVGLKFYAARLKALEEIAAVSGYLTDKIGDYLDWREFGVPKADPEQEEGDPVRYPDEEIPHPSLLVEEAQATWDTYRIYATPELLALIGKQREIVMRPDGRNLEKIWRRVRDVDHQILNEIRKILKLEQIEARLDDMHGRRVRPSETSEGDGRSVLNRPAP